MLKKYLLLLFFISLYYPHPAFAQDESVTFTTYYPSPYGDYNNLTTNNFIARENVTLATEPGSRVGIGTTELIDRKLTIAGSNANTVNALGLTNTDTTNNNKVALYFQTKRTDGAMVAPVSLYGITTDHSSTSVDGEFAISTVYDNTEFERLRITNSGNVGIGTTSPGQKLHVYTTGETRALIEGSRSTAYGMPSQCGAYLNLRNTYSGTGVGSTISVLNNAGYVTSAIVGYTENQGGSGAAQGELSFWTTNAGTYVERVRIDNNGNVGIGTETPTRKLDVVGSLSDGGIAYHIGDTLDRVAAVGLCAGVVGRTSGYGAMRVVKSNGNSCASTCDSQDTATPPYNNFQCFGSVDSNVATGNVNGGNIIVASAWFGVDYCGSTNGMAIYCCCKAQY